MLKVNKRRHFRLWPCGYKFDTGCVSPFDSVLRRNTAFGLPVVKGNVSAPLRGLGMFDSYNAADSAAINLSPARAWEPLVRRTRFCAPLKRVFDVCVAVAILTLFAWAYAVIAVAIVMETKGPVLFRQRRTGRYGKVFTIYKFRSMTVTEDGPAISHATRADHRVTRVGAFIRATSLDELPQLLNVIRGDMSLVGPRPHALAHDVHYGALISHYGKRFSVRPGLTGLAQVQGHRGEIHELDCMARRIDADADYAAGWSFPDDIAIIARTIPLLVARTNAY